MGSGGSGQARRSWRGTSPTWAVRRLLRAKTGNRRITGTFETLDHSDQPAGIKGLGRDQGYREEIPEQTTRESRQKRDWGPTNANQQTMRKMYRARRRRGFPANGGK